MMYLCKRMLYANILNKMIKSRIDVINTLKSMDVGEVIYLEGVNLNTLRCAATKLRAMNRRYKVNVTKDAVRVSCYE